MFRIDFRQRLIAVGNRSRPIRTAKKATTSAEMHKKMLKEFDANKDGKLDDQECAKPREKIGQMQRLTKRSASKRVNTGKKAAHGPKGDKGTHHGAEARRGPQPPNPEVVREFDKDKDGKLSKDEFMALVKSVHEHMQHMVRRRSAARSRIRGTATCRNFS